MILGQETFLIMQGYTYNQSKDTSLRLNTSLLNDPQSQKFIKREFKDYISNNNNGAVSPSILWDAAKAVIWGKLIML